ncbi:MAG: hypothetical protein K1X88_23985 [Nannocystaceae bacterium]|nr:hypothetical protein [Nannocystaceae bacterium]
MRSRSILALSSMAWLGCFSESYLGPGDPDAGSTTRADASDDAASGDATDAADASAGSSTDAGTSGASTGSDDGSTGSDDTVGSTGDGGSFGPLTPGDNLDDGAMYPAAQGYSAHWYPSGEDNADGHQYLGQFPNGAQYYAYIRFELPAALPAGAVVEHATLELAGHDEYAWGGAYALRVWVQDTPDAPVVSGTSDYPQDGGAVVLSDDSVRWPELGGLPWQQPGPNATPDLAPLLQSLVDTHGGLAAGAHVQFWIGEDVLDGSGEEVGWFDSIAGQEHAPRLTLRVSPP